MKNLLSILLCAAFFIVQTVKAQNLEFKKGNVLKGTEVVSTIKTLAVGTGKGKYEVKDAAGNVLVNLNEIVVPLKSNIHQVIFPSLNNEMLTMTVSPTSMNFNKAIFDFLYTETKILNEKGIDNELVSKMIAAAKPKPIPVPIVPVAPVVAVAPKNPNYFNEDLIVSYNPKETEKLWRYLEDNNRKTPYTLTPSPQGSDVKNGLTLVSNVEDLNWHMVRYPAKLKFHVSIKNNTDQLVKYIYARPFHKLFFAKLEIYRDGKLIENIIIDDNTPSGGMEREKFDKSNLRVLKPGETAAVIHFEIPKLEEGNYTIKASYKIDKKIANSNYVDAKYLTQFDEVELFMKDVSFKVEIPKGVVNNEYVVPSLAPLDLRAGVTDLWGALNNPTYAFHVTINGLDMEQAKYLKNLVNLKYLFINDVKDMNAFSIIKDLDLKGLNIFIGSGINAQDWNKIPANFLKPNCIESLFLTAGGGISEQIPAFLSNQKQLKKLYMNTVKTNIAQIPTYFPILEELSFGGLPHQTAEVASLKNAKKLSVLSIRSVNLDNLDFLAEMPSLKKVEYKDVKHNKLNEATYPVLKKISDEKNVQVYFYDLK